MKGNTMSPVAISKGTRPENDIAKLREAVELVLGRALRTPKEFDQLSAAIHHRLGVMLSRNTLRRLWGNMEDVAQPRRSTLDFVARFLGYTDMDDFVAQMGKELSDTSNAVMNRRIHLRHSRCFTIAQFTVAVGVPMGNADLLCRVTRKDDWGISIRSLRLGILM